MSKDNHEIVESPLDYAAAVENEDRTTPYVWMLVLASSISGLLFGYDTGVISGALVTIRGDLGPAELSNIQKEFITSATTLGALIGGFVAGILSDIIGRKWVLGIADIIFIAGAAGQAVSHTVPAMVGGRFVIGIGVGLAACIVPLFVGEISPTRQRGRLVTVNVVSITLGQVVAYGIGAAFESTKGGWRWMVGIGAIPAALQLFLLPLLPESPRILLRRGERDVAYGNLAKIYPYASPDQIERRLKLMEDSVKESIRITETTTFGERFLSIFSVPSNRRALIVACGLQAFQQLCGFNTLMYYSATLFKSIGFNKPTAVGLIISGTNFIFTLFALKYIDIVGRRRIMIFSSPGMIFGLTLASVSFFFLTRKTHGVLVDGTVYPKSWSYLVLFSMVFYVASYATGLGNVPWQQAELFNLEVRGIGASLATATNWSGNLIIGATYLSLIHKITAAGAFGFYAGLCFLGWVFCLICYPETAGLSLEEVNAIFKEDFGIKAAERLRREKNFTRGQTTMDGESERDKKPDEPRPFIEEYFRNDFLHATSRMQMLSGVVKTRITKPITALRGPCLPETITVDVSQLPGEAITPTHILALRSGRPSAPTRYFPIHALPLLAHCLDIPTVMIEARIGPTTSLPLLPLTLPSPSTFHILIDFFYRLHLPTLSKALLPVDGKRFQEVAKKNWPRTAEAAACIYAQTMSIGELADAAKRVYGVYQNACALGMWDEGFWAAITMAWTIILHTRSLLKREMTGHDRRASA
ncbi:myo-inositol transporter [Tulasnella sp. 332]|nr:myo-inositol transporter [Tulasnella sp. 332]